MAVCILLLTAVVSALSPLSAQAAGTVLFQNAFNNRTVDGTGTVSLPTPTIGVNAACLTAFGNSATPPLLSCSGSTDAQGSGKLRMTAATGDQIGGIFGQTSFPTSNGLDVTFNTYQWGGGGADGMAFMLAAVDPANPAAPTTIGPGGGSLGYSPSGSIKGLPNAYLGVGFDVYGNYSSFGGSGCPTVTNITAQTPGAVVVRGPGNNLAGYCALKSTYDGTTASKVTLRASTRAASLVPVQVLINPSTSAFTSSTGVSVSPGTYKVVVTPVGSAAKTLTGSLPTVAAGVYPATSWLTSAGVPKQLAFAFVGSTGSVTDAHEASDVKVLTFNPVPQLAVASTSYSAATPQPGAPVTYTLAGSVLAGADETSPISITQTTPAGVVPVGAYGTGWVCAAPIGQNLTCTTSSSNINNGTALPALTVVAIVTGSSITSTTVQNSSATRIASTDGNPATDTVAAAGTLPTAPSGITVTPAIGPIAGGNAVTVGGSNIAGATAIEIGTTAEQTGGTPATLLPCVAPATAGCFSVSGSTLVIASMPARPASATVTVTVVTAGLAAAANYTYAAAPSAPAAPGATAGVSSATVTWAQPASNGGSAITGYTITEYLGTTVVAAVTATASEFSRTFPNLTPGGSYSYTVAATNAYGTSAASTKSTAVVPYTVPGAPAITATNPGTSSATLTWSAPSSTGFSPITGYVVTPYIGQTAQPAQAFASTATTQTITGLTPGTAYTFTVAAQNAAGIGSASARSATVVPNLAPSLTFPGTMNGEVGVAFSRPLTVSDGTSPFTWSISSGAVPAGLSLNPSTGVLNGTPTTAETATFTVRVIDASGQIATKQVTFTVAAVPSISFTPPSGEVGVPFTAQPVLSGGTPAITWSISAGSLPGGLTFNTSTGQLTGTPTTAGSFTLAITATDSFGQSATKTVTIVIVALPAFTFVAPTSAQVGVAYSYSFDVSGGSTPLTWSITAGTLPAGLSLNSATGVVSGTPTTSTNAPVTVTVTDANNKSASKNTTLIVNAGPLVITKSANVTSAASGAVVSYSIVITNSSTSDFTGVSLTENLAGVIDDAIYNGNASATSGAVTYTAPTLSWSGAVSASGSVSITYSVTINTPDAGDKVLTSRVTSSTLGTNCAAASTDTRCVTSVTVPGLTIAITPSTTTTTPGEVVTFTVTARNSGQTPLTTAAFVVNVAGSLDDGVYNPGAQATVGTLSYSAPTLTWTGSLAVGASVTVTYSVTVSDPDTGNRMVTGVVTSSTAGSTCPSGSQAAACSASAIVRIPALAVTTTTPSSSTTPGSTVPFTVTISNTGQVPYTASTGRQATVTTSFVEALDDGVYAGNAATTAGSVRFDTASGSLIWTGDLAVGASVTVTASVTVNPTVTGDKTLLVTSSSPAPGSACPAGGTGASCSATVQILVPALSIRATADTQTTTPGSTVTFTLSVSNTGQTPYSGASFSDSLTGILDDATYDNNATASAGAVSMANQTLTWTGDLAVGASATIRFTATVKNPDTGDLALINRVTSTTVGSNCAAASTDPLCRTSVAVLIPGLTFASTFDAATTTPGSTLTYTATITNSGQTPYSGAGIALDLAGALDDASYNRDARVSAGSITFAADGTASWTLPLAPGASATLIFSVTAFAPDPGDRSLRIRISSTAAGSTCPPGSSNAACLAVSTLLVPGLTIIKSADNSAVSPGGRVTYTVTATNTGETSFVPARLTDSLAMVITDAVYANDVVASTGTATYDTGSTTLAWQGDLAPGRSVTITYSVVILDPDPGDKRIINTVSSSTPGTNCAAGSTDARCTSIVDILVPSLSITNTADTATTVPGASVAYTVTVTNTGPTVYSPASFTSSLTDVLDDAVVTAGPTSTSGTATLTGTTLSWTGALQPGTASRITFTVKVNAADGGNNGLTNTITSTSKGSTCSAARSAAACSVTVPVARLVLQQQYSSPTTTPGSTLTLTATFTNTGKVDYNGISVTSPSADTVDDAIPTGDQQASSGSLVLSSTAITWTGNIPAGGLVTVTGTLTVASPATGNKTITGTLQSQAPGNNCAAQTTDPRCTATSTVLIPALAVTVSASATATLPGSTVGYTVTIHNTGQTPYSQTKVDTGIAGALDDAIYNNDAAATAGTVSFAAAAVSWRGDLTPGQTVTVTYSLTVSNPDPADKTMVTQVVSDAPGSVCSPAATNTFCRNTVVVLTPALTVVKTSDVSNVTLGSTVVFTITVTNTGQTSYPNATFTDALTDVTDDATLTAGSLTATTGTATLSAGTISWTGALAPTASATITYAVAVNSPSTGNRTMTNTVVSNAAGSNCATGSTDTRCTAVVAVTNVVSLTIEKTANVAYAAAGTTVTYTVTIMNASASPTRTPNFTDSLAGVLDDAVYNNNASTDVGTVQLTGSTLVWQGTLTPGAKATLSYSVTISAPDGGDQRLVSNVTSTSVPASNNCIAGSTDPRCSSLVLVAGLLISQHYTETSTTPGSLVHLTATFTNTGQYPYNGISIQSPSADSVDDAVPSGDQTASSGTLILSAGAVTWTGSIPVGATVTVSGTLTVTNPDTGNRVLRGTLTSNATGNNCAPNSTDARCTATLAVLIPGLTVTKTASTTFVVPGGTATYTLSVRNTGETPYTGASITDVLSGVLDDAVYNADATATTGVVVYTEPELAWTGNLAVGAAAVITYSVTAFNPATGDKTMINPVSSTDVGSTCPPSSGNAACRSTVAVLTPALTLTSSSSTASTLPGSTVTFTITATNTGQVPFGAATFTVPLGDVLDDSTVSGAPTASAGTATLNASARTLAWTGALAVGSTATISYSAVVGAPPAGNYLLTQTVTSASPGSTCSATQSDVRCSSTVTIASLAIRNHVDAATTKPTSVVTYTGVFTNTGTVPYTGISVSDSFVGTLDDATYNGDATATSGSLIIVVGSGQIVWTGDIAVGQTVTITGTVTVNNPPTGDGTLRTRLSSSAPANNCTPGSTDTTCSTSVTVLVPGLRLTAAADRSVVSPGAVVTYTTTITNTGQTGYTGAVVDTDLTGALTDGTFLSPATATAGALVLSGRILRWTGDLALGASVTVQYGVRVDDPDLGDRVMVTAVSSVELGSSCPAGTASPACRTLVTVLVPALDLAITANHTNTVPGGSVGYTVTIRNTGQTVYTGATVTVDLSAALDDALYPVDAATTRGTVAAGSGSLIWTGDLSLGDVALVTYTLVVKDPDTGNRNITSTITSNAVGSTCASGACVSAVTVLIPGLALSQTADAATTTPGTRTGFTITVANVGQTPYDAAQLSAALSDMTDDGEVDPGIVSTTGVATVSGSTLRWTGSLPVGATALISYAVTVNEPPTGNRVLTSRVVADVAGSTCTTTSDNPACTVTTVIRIPGLTISTAADAPTATPGDRAGFSVLISNTGETPFASAVVTDSLAGVVGEANYNGDATADTGTLQLVGTDLVWTGALQVGATVRITFSATVNNPYTGDRDILNRVSSEEQGSTCPPGATAPACSADIRVLIPALQISSTASTATVVAGQTVSYRIRIANTGQTVYSSATIKNSLTGLLDDATYNQDASATVGAVSYAAGSLTWIGPLAVGATAEVTFTATVNFPITGDKTLRSTATSTSRGANCVSGTETGCRTQVGVIVPGLTITKSAAASTVVAGGRLSYTIVATNSGESDFQGAVITDNLAGVLDDAVYNGDAVASSGTVSGDSSTLTWTGDLARGQTATITYTVTAGFAETGDATLLNTVASPTIGSTCVTGSGAAGNPSSCRVAVPVAARTISISGLTDSFTLTGLPGATVTRQGAVTMTVTTNSSSGYSVSVRPLTDRLAPADPANGESIPIARLLVRPDASQDFVPLSTAVPITTFSKNQPSAPGGDAVINDFRVQIPFVADDTYSATLEYIVSAQ